MQHPKHRTSGIAAWALLASLFLLALPMTSHATEEPDYEVVQKLEDIEIRAYASYAVIRFSGFWSASNYSQHLEQLQTAVRGAKLAWVGEPVYSRYNAPFTPWFLRRNEIWLHLANTP